MLHDSFMTTWTSGNHNERSPREPFREPEGLSAPVSSFVETIVGNMPNSLPNPLFMLTSNEVGEPIATDNYAPCRFASSINWPPLGLRARQFGRVVPISAVRASRRFGKFHSAASARSRSGEGRRQISARGGDWTPGISYRQVSGVP